MFRVGLTGDLGSGKSTVARLLRECGAIVLSSDEMARAVMEPGEPVYRALVERFGADVLDPSGRLDRAELARLAFDPELPRVGELNAIVHPAVLSAQEVEIQRLVEEHPDAIVVVESALIFSVKAPVPEGVNTAVLREQTEPWRSRFDCVVVVTAPRSVKIERFVSRAFAADKGFSAPTSTSKRAALEADAARRLAAQAETAVPKDDALLTLDNSNGLDELAAQVDALWEELRQRAEVKATGRSTDRRSTSRA